MGSAGAGPAGSHEFELAARLAAIVESSDDAILGKTLDGTITTWNSGAVRMYGYTPDEIIGHNVALLLPAGRQDELAPILGRLSRGERVEPYETRRRRKDGTVIDVSVCISPILDRAGTVIGASSVARDVTERNRMEAERRALEKAQYRSERLEILGQLAGGIAHDFNNLLAAIMNYAGFVVQDTADRPPVQADAEQIQIAAQRAARLTRQLLIFGRREEIEPEQLDLNEVLADMHSLLVTSLGAAIRLQLVPQLQPATVLADRGHVEQVLLNLVINARDAMPGGGSLRIRTTAAELGTDDTRAHPTVSPGRYVELTVTDTGTGMDPDVAARIFEPFFTTKVESEGTGLGLSTVYGIVTQAGGSVTVESAPGAGTTFRCYFPAAGLPAGPGTQAGAGPAGPPPEPERPAAGPGGPHRAATVLVVDDEPAVLAAASRILRRHGYTTLEAGSCEQALSLAGQDFQLLLTDSVMPGMSGLTLAEEVTRLKPGLRVLHMSGNDAAALGAQAAAGSGELARVQKPFSAAELIAKVRDALGD
jgi:two-component system, cell cycle sensor histidine kinase and response regulator CckA